ncbi:acyl-CoA dehydrogenase NM domain-like protein [Gymnopus androsaceus JB14]|uniref:Acyl-CoA dehydrogenase NM domain-like protein n=1 Tax=Gymnopus androsaceus JB14 TaxID=1447944 RepID=A0A6A4HHN1_9AGAR|nr:acyl-CoA dehydrogenase NM domain-like protein [Gymnopus androsaceus JB14]
MATPQGQHLACTHLFLRAVRDWELGKEYRLTLAHQRAKAIVSAFEFTLDEILSCSERFWDSNMDPINLLDGAATTLWTIHLNLATATIAQFAKDRPELQELCRKLLLFEVSAQYMVTEVGHGLDTQNIETRVTLLSNGSLDLHTPNPGLQTCRFMPPTLPAGGLPRIGIVMARLIIGDTDHGIRPFIVPLNDGLEMHPGVSCRLMPWREGTRPVGHSITSFNHVNLPPTALLGSLRSILPSRVQFLHSIWRLGIGSATISAVTIPALRLYAYIVATYSRRRKVTNTRGETVPIISFRTTQIPIVRALAQAAALEALFKEIRVYFGGQPGTALELDALQIRNALAAVFKTTAIYHYRGSSVELTDRLGAQGLYVQNQLVGLEQEIRGLTIAEGDVTVLCIRLASELLLGRYSVPPPRNPSSFLALHEHGIFEDMQVILKSIGGKYRSEEFNRLLLPQSVALIRSIGSRMAYEAMISAGVHPELVALYEASTISQDMAWYIEGKVVVGKKQVMQMEEAAIGEAYSKLDVLLNEIGIEPYVQAPIVSEDKWKNWVESMPVLRNKSDMEIPKYQGSGNHAIVSLEDQRAKL